jgi:membrane protein
MWRLFTETFSHWCEDNPAQLSAALAFYAIFAIAPLLIIAVAIAGLVFGVHATQNQIVDAIDGLVGAEIAAAIQATVKNASHPQAGKIATLIGIVTLFVGAAGVVMQLKHSLNAIWEVAPKPGRGVFAVVWEYLGAFLAVLGIGVFLLLSLALSTAVAALSRSVTIVLPHGIAFWQWVDLGVSLGLITVLFALTYKVLPSARIAWRDVWIGALMTAALFTLGKQVIGEYLAYSSVTSAYGAAGSIIVLLLWVYYSAQVFFFGAEFTHVYARRYGSGVVPTKNAIFVPKRIEMARPPESET